LRVLASFEWLGSLETPAPALAPPEPPRDLDGDGVLDEVDVCPGTAGPARPDEPARNGCPQPVDTDGDGLSDADDACPDTWGAPSSDPARHGCPVSDGDRDGIVDAVDACPDRAGVQHADPRRNGCPTDSDSDGILDVDDACPGAAGTANADPKLHGCPKARIEQGEIRIGEQVKFALGSARILPESDELLGAVREILLEHPEIELVSVEGHTDATGTAALNVRLSRGRAAAVVDWLVERGVDRRRLASQGFGSERPIADNATEAGRRNNRRVEFRIVRTRAAGAAPARSGASP
jgi:outer membrane protein OmpA-like peptidoglycan-associated protein